MCYIAFIVNGIEYKFDFANDSELRDNIIKDDNYAVNYIKELIKSKFLPLTEELHSIIRVVKIDDSVQSTIIYESSPDYEESQTEYASQDFETASSEEPQTSQSIAGGGRSEAQRAAWQYNETKALLASVTSHYEDFTHPRKRKFVFENVSNELLGQNFIKAPAQCQIKWKSLVRSYKSHKDIINKSGRGSMRFLFFEEMDDLLGNKPSIACRHTLNSADIATTEQMPPESMEAIALPVSTSTAGSVEMDDNPGQQGPGVGVKRKRKTATITEKYLKMKREEFERRQKRHEERLEIEKKKLALLEDYLKKRSDDRI